MLALAGLVGVGVTARLAAEQGLAIQTVLAVSVLFLMAGLLGAKAQWLIEAGSLRPLQQELLSGYRYSGAAAALLLAAPLARRLVPTNLTLRRVGDLFAPGAAFAMAAIRINCFLDGCCAGGRCSYPWCLRFPAQSPPWFEQVREGSIASWDPSSSPVHPVQLYLLLASAAVGFILLGLRRRTWYEGQLVLYYFALHDGAKFLLEFLTVPRVPAAQIGAFATSVAAWGLLLGLRLRRLRAASAVAAG